jgi:hypothetical protein
LKGVRMSMRRLSLFLPAMFSSTTSEAGWQSFIRSVDFEITFDHLNFFNCWQIHVLRKRVVIRHAWTVSTDNLISK